MCYKDGNLADHILRSIQYLIFQWKSENKDEEQSVEHIQ